MRRMVKKAVRNAGKGFTNEGIEINISIHFIVLFIFWMHENGVTYNLHNQF